MGDIGFEQVSTDLRREADYFFHGPLIPGILPFSRSGKHIARGQLHPVKEEKGYGFLSIRTGLSISDVRDDVFCHISEIREDGKAIENAAFAEMGRKGAILEFELVEQADGKLQARDAVAASS